MLQQLQQQAMDTDDSLETLGTLRFGSSSSPISSGPFSRLNVTTQVLSTSSR